MMTPKQAKQARKDLMDAAFARQIEIQVKLSHDPENTELRKKLEWLDNFSEELMITQMAEDHLYGL
jgi:hypothetical protein